MKCDKGSAPSLCFSCAYIRIVHLYSRLYCYSVFINAHISAQTGPVILFVQCYTYGSTVLAVSSHNRYDNALSTPSPGTTYYIYFIFLFDSNVTLCVFIKLHITAQPGLVILIFQCYTYGCNISGISACLYCTKFSYSSCLITFFAT